MVRLALASLARSSGFDEDKVDDLKIVVSEACTNAVMATEEAGSTAPILIRWIAEEEGGRVTVEVEDQVPEAAASSLEDSQGIATRQAMSVALLQSLVESYETRPGADGAGTVTRLSF